MSGKVTLASLQEIAEDDHARERLENLADNYARAVYIGDNKALTQVLARYLMVVDAKDYAVSPHLIMHGCWEAWITLRMLRHLRPGMRCADIGSNMGYYTCLMADVCGAENVSAFDPLFDCRATLGMNGFDDVAFHALALGDKRTNVDLHIPKGHASSATLNPSIIRGTHDVLIQRVPVVRFDDLPWNGPEFRFIKIDAEGAEPAIWRGMQWTWERSPELQVCLEFDPDFYLEPSMVLCELARTARIDVVDHDGDLVRGLERGANAVRVLDELVSYMRAHHSNMLWLTHTRPDQAVKER